MTEKLSDKEIEDFDIEQTDQYPVMPLRNTVLFPQQVIPIYIGRDRSLKLINELDPKKRYIVVVAQEDGSIEDPKPEDLYSYGTLAQVLKVFDMPDNSKSAIVQGISRVKILEYVNHDPYFAAAVSSMEDEPIKDELEVDALANKLRQAFEDLMKVAPNLTEEHSGMLKNIQKPNRLTDRAISVITISNQEKQEILEELDIKIRIEKALNLISREVQRIKLGEEIQSEVHDEITKTQREYYLREQMKAIKKELGEDESTVELKELEDKIKAVKMPEESQKVAMKELDRLSRIPTQSPEYNVSRTYIEWLVDLPWSESTDDRIDLKEAMKILDEDHYGLEKVKERIIEFLAVQKRIQKMKGPILCLVGPPGVGKTSLGKSIAKATNRKFIRISLGGIRDEAEIRGHRRTYIGSLPGKIIQMMKKAGTKNPLFLLDEIDKVGNDYRGDPSSALLEALDPEQNKDFNDHYLEVDYDLSDVMFVTTANTLNILPPLLDRMEVIRLSGYTEDEKVNISQKFLIPNQSKNNGLKKEEWAINENINRKIIANYTRESGVRNLEREISKIARKLVKKIDNNEKVNNPINEKDLKDLLGVQKFNYGEIEEENRIGVVTGLAWTEVGGEILKIESVVMPGKGKMQITGKLGEVMQESVKAAKSYIRSKSLDYGIIPPIFDKKDFHIHVPEGATPKDGPSAGIAMVTSIISAVTEVPVNKNVAMTGEITLRGLVLPIGGLKEKLLAAHRAGIKKVLIPIENKKDLIEVPKTVLDKIEIIPVKNVDEVLKIALIKPLKRVEWVDIDNVKKTKDNKTEVTSRH